MQYYVSYRGNLLFPCWVNEAQQFCFRNEDGSVLTINKQDCESYWLRKQYNQSICLRIYTLISKLSMLCFATQSCRSSSRIMGLQIGILNGENPSLSRKKFRTNRGCIGTPQQRQNQYNQTCGAYVLEYEGSYIRHRIVFTITTRINTQLSIIKHQCRLKNHGVVQP